MQPIKLTTLAQIKKFAKIIGKQLNITHAHALERAAKEAGFANFRSAKVASERATLDDKKLSADPFQKENVALGLGACFLTHETMCIGTNNSMSCPLYLHKPAAPNDNGAQDPPH